MIRCLNCNALIDHQEIARQEAAAEANMSAGEFEDLLENLEVAAAEPVKSESELNGLKNAMGSSSMDTGSMDSMTSVVELVEESPKSPAPKSSGTSAATLASEDTSSSEPVKSEPPSIPPVKKQIPEVTWIPPEVVEGASEGARPVTPEIHDLDSEIDLDSDDQIDVSPVHQTSKLASMTLTIPDAPDAPGALDEHSAAAKNGATDQPVKPATRIAASEAQTSHTPALSSLPEVDEPLEVDPAVIAAKKQAWNQARKQAWNQARKQVLEKVKQADSEQPAEAEADKNASFEDLLTGYESKQSGVSDAEREAWCREAEEKEAARRLYPAYFDPEKKKQAEMARTGILVKLRFMPLLFWLFSSEARVDINGDPYQTPWGEHFIPLKPGTYQVTAYWRFLFFRRGGKASLTVDVKKDKEAVVKYFVWMPYVNRLSQH